jgi:hypothetical protein
MRSRTDTLSTPYRRILGVASAFLAGVVGTLVVPAAQQPAQAADTIQCDPTASIFATQTGGALVRYPRNAPGTDTGWWSKESTVGSGWNIFSRVLGGPDGRVYGINGEGLSRYRWTGSGWEIVAGTTNARWQISTDFKEYGNTTQRDKITVDEIGDIYTIDSVGRLRWHRFDEATKTWTVSGRAIASNWGQYNLIVAGSAGVIYARTADGKLYRNRFDAASQRWIVQDLQVGNGWGIFTKGIFSVGGDTLFGIKANGDLLQYRYREDNNTWPIGGKVIGVQWAAFTNVLGTTNACRLNVSYTPPLQTIPKQAYSAVSVMQAPAVGGQALGTLEYAYTSGLGLLVHARQTNPDDFNSAQWETVPAPDTFSGTPALVADAQGLVNITAHSTTSNISSLTQSAPNMPGWKPWLQLGGAMKSKPAVVRLSDNTLAVFAVDADGALWFRSQDGTDSDLLGWRKLGGTGLTGDPVVVAKAGVPSAFVLALDGNGTPQAATYTAGTLSPWASLGGSGFTHFSTLLLPGNQVQVFARAADGTIMTQLQNVDGTFPGTWATVGTFTATGAPTAILDPALRRIAVVARGDQDEVYRVFETAEASQVWGDWARINPDVSDPAASDPTLAAYRGTNGDSWLIAYRNSNNAVRIYERRLVPNGLTAQRDTEFNARTLPKPTA